MMALQSSMKEGMQKAQADSDQFTAKYLKSPEVTSALAGLKIAPKSPEAAQFAGVMSLEIQRYEAQNNKPPSDADLHGIVMNVTQKVGGNFFSQGQPAFEVPASARAQIVADFQRRGENPTEMDIARRYRILSGGQ